MANPRHVFRPEGNAWLQQLEDQIVLGPSHVFEYIKTDGYKRLVDEERFTSFFTIFMSIKQSILHDYNGNTVQERGHIRGTQRQFPPKYIENTFYAIWSTFRSLEMYSKQYYKICIFLVVLGELKSFQNYKGFSIILFF